MRKEGGVIFLSPPKRKWTWGEPIAQTQTT